MNLRRRPSSSIYFILISYLLALGTSTLSKLSLRQKADYTKVSKGGQRIFVDDNNRQVILHGVNAVVKGPPYIPTTNEFDVDTSLTQKDYSTLADLGVNVIRLGTMWAGLQPEGPENFNESYISEVQKIVGEAEKFGIYSLLDMHQDVFSEYFCGEGVPNWVVVPYEAQPFPIPLDNPFIPTESSGGFPTRADCNKHGWASYYNTFATSYAFSALYKNESGLLTSWGNFWAFVAEKLSVYNGTLGYELINEPWAGDVFHEPTLFIPSEADKKVLQPAYNTLADAIRSKDPNGIIFFAAVTWDDIVPVGFTSAPGSDADAAAKGVLAFHYYEPPQYNLEVYFHQRIEDAKRLSVGAMITEFERQQVQSTDYDDPYTKTADKADELQLS